MLSDGVSSQRAWVKIRIIIAFLINLQEIVLCILTCLFEPILCWYQVGTGMFMGGAGAGVYILQHRSWLNFRSIQKTTELPTIPNTSDRRNGLTAKTGIQTHRLLIPVPVSSLLGLMSGETACCTWDGKLIRLHKSILTYT